VPWRAALGRGWWERTGGRTGEGTHVPYRQWTLSFPHRVRWVLLKDVGLRSDVLTLFLRAVFALQRRGNGGRAYVAGRLLPCCSSRSSAPPCR